MIAEKGADMILEDAQAGAGAAPRPATTFAIARGVNFGSYQPIVLPEGILGSRCCSTRYGDSRCQCAPIRMVPIEPKDNLWFSR